MEDNSSHAHIALIEDDPSISDVVSEYLTKRGMSCTQAYSGSEARLLLEKQQSAPGKSTFDLIITDLMLPGCSGQELVELIRTHEHVPVIVISALVSPASKVELFEMGADDYLTKPFDLDELYARILVQLRHKQRMQPTAEQSTNNTNAHDSVLTHNDWTLKTQERSLEAAGTPIKLTRIEYNIIEVLMRHPTKVFTKQELFEAAWNEECFVEEKAINVHISNIRAKLKPSGTHDYIQTVWGIGFKLS